MSDTVLKYNLDITEESRWITVTATQTARSGLLYVQELGDFLCGENYYTMRSGLDSYQIILSLGGKGRLQYRGCEYEVPAGSIIWLDCTESQYYYTDKTAGHWHTLWVHLYGANAKAYHDLFDSLNGSSPVAVFGNDVTLKSLLDMLLKLYSSPVGTINEDVRSASLLTQLLTRCIQTVSEVSGTGRIPAYVQDVRSYIELHYAERLTLDSLASAISINKFYLQKLFKRNMGISPNEYLLHVRLNHAKQLLRTTNYPIARIADEVGISNIGHFVEVFKKYENATPGAYRIRWYNSEIPADD